MHANSMVLAHMSMVGKIHALDRAALLLEAVARDAERRTET